MGENTTMHDEGNINSQNISNEECELPKKVSGGYNLDFLDNLEDPNFNPFVTKTRIVEAFGESNTSSAEHPIDEALLENIKKTPVKPKKAPIASKKKPDENKVSS